MNLLALGLDGSPLKLDNPALLIAYAIVTAVVVLFGLYRAFVTCRGWRRDSKAYQEEEKKKAEDAASQKADSRVSAERAVSSVFERATDALEIRERILEKQLQEATITIKAHEITIERQVRALADCWSAHPQTRHHVDIMMELETTRQRQDLLEAQLEESPRAQEKG